MAITSSILFLLVPILEVFENMNVNHNDRLEHPRDIKQVISETLKKFLNLE